MTRRDLILFFWVMVVASFLAGESFGQTNARGIVGQGATFAVTGDGAEPFTYQWYKGGNEIQGATGPNYLIAKIALVDAGIYTARITNNFGSALSDQATLTVAPMLATLSANVTNLNYPPPAIYQWRLDGHSIPGANGPTYQFDPGTAPGSYSVTITWPNITP